MNADAAVPGPPFSAELLADLHADALPPDVAAALWPRVRADEDAMGVLAALDRARAALADLGADASFGAPIPPDVLARIETALPTPVVDLAARRRRRWLLGGAATVGVAAAAAFVVTLVVLDEPAAPTPQAHREIGADLPPDSLLAALGSHERPGALADPSVLAGCLTANGLAPTAPVLGSAEIEFDGTDAVLILTAGSKPAQVRALVVGPGCSAGDAQTLAVKDIG